MATFAPPPRPSAYALAPPQEVPSATKSRWKLPEKVQEELQEVTQPRSRWKLPPQIEKADTFPPRIEKSNTADTFPSLLSPLRRHHDNAGAVKRCFSTSSIMASILEDDDDDDEFFSCEARDDVPQRVRAERHNHRVRVAMMLKEQESGTLVNVSGVERHSQRVRVAMLLKKEESAISGSVEGVLGDNCGVSPNSQVSFTRGARTNSSESTGMNCSAISDRPNINDASNDHSCAEDANMCFSRGPSGRRVCFADESPGLPLEEVREYDVEERRGSRLSDMSLDSDDGDGVALVSKLARLR